MVVRHLEDDIRRAKRTACESSASFMYSHRLLRFCAKRELLVAVMFRFSGRHYENRQCAHTMFRIKRQRISSRVYLSQDAVSFKVMTRTVNVV
jgi:hypothetical protein